MRLSKKFTVTFPIPNDPDRGEVTVRHMPPGEVEDVQEEMNAFQTVMKTGEDGKMAPEMRQNGNLGDKRYLFPVRAIDSWKNVKDAEGKDVPCTPEGKIAVCREAEVEKENGEIVSFGTWVNECRAEVAKQKLANREAAAKN